MTAEKSRDPIRAFIALLAVAGLVSFNLWYTSHERLQADIRWCELMVALDDRYRALPSPAPEAAKLAESISELRKNLQCSEPGPVTTDPRPSPSRS